VVCQDCHEFHTAALRASGNALCLRCHVAELATPAHTHHVADSPGGECVACHMPEAVFMERDRRRDHRIARPDPRGALTIGAPDACTACHRDRSQQWAAEQVERWREPTAALLAQRRMSMALAAGRGGDENAAPGLVALLTGGGDAVRRASAARLLAGWLDTPGVTDALRAAARDRDTLVRAGAVRALGDAAPDRPDVQQFLLRAATDPRRLVRVEAGFALRGVRDDALTPADRDAVAAARAEWLQAQAAVADLPDAQFNQGVFWTARGRPAEAEAAYRRALRLWPADLAPRQNLATLLFRLGRPAEAEAEFRAALAQVPGWPPASCGLGRLLAESARWTEAAEVLADCVSPETAVQATTSR
jgi:predicted CXXCH cytochrome family protein